MMKGKLMSLLAILVPAAMLSLPVLVLSTILGVGGWQGFLLGAVTGACSVGLVILVVTLFKLEDER